jgi:hypothetical protein
LLKLYKAMGYRWRSKTFVQLGKRHHTVTALGRWQYSGDNLHKLIPFSPWCRGWQPLVSADNFDAHTVFGSDYPNTVHSQERAPHCGVERTVKQYNKVLM